MSKVPEGQSGKWVIRSGDVYLGPDGAWGSIRKASRFASQGEAAYLVHNFMPREMWQFVRVEQFQQEGGKPKDRPDLAKQCEVCGHWLHETPSYLWCSNCDLYINKTQAWLSGFGPNGTGSA